MQQSNSSLSLRNKHQSAHVIIGEQDKVRRFWDFYGRAGQSPRLMCRELLLEQRWPVEVLEPVNLRQAMHDDLDLIAPVHCPVGF